MRNTVIAVAGFICAARILGLLGLFAELPPIVFQVFKDIAHLFVGGLIAVAIFARYVGRWLTEVWRLGPLQPHDAAVRFSTVAMKTYDWRMLCFHLSVILTLLEIVCAVVSILIGR